MIISSFVDNTGVRYTVQQELPWMPVSGEIFFSPDLLSLRVPVAELVWQGSDSDLNLLSMKFVYKTRHAAMAKYRLLKSFCYMIAEEE